MDKKHEQDFADLEVKRLCGVFGTPIPALPLERDKALDKVKEPPVPAGAWNGSGDKETPPPHPSSCDGVRGGTGADPGAHGRGGHPQHGAYMRKMALNGYVLHVDLSPVQELVSLQRRCSNNLNQVAIQANTYGGIYPEEIKALQRDYEKLWRPVRSSEKLSAIVRL